MNRVLKKRLLRDLKSNLLRYLALVLLIIMGMYIVVSVVGAADTIITGTADRAEQNRVEDGQFGVFIPLTEEQANKLTDTGISLERMFSIDMEVEDGSIIRLMKNREQINLIDLDEGHLSKEDGEIVLEKRYCEVHGLKLGDSITISGVKFEIVGIGSTPDYDMPTRKFSDMSVESNSFGTAFVTNQQYVEMKERISSRAEDYCYAYRLNASGVTDDDVKQMLKDFDYSQMIQMLDEYFSVDIDNLTSFVKKADNPRILTAAGDQQINKRSGLLAGVIVMVLFTYVISVFVIHQIQRESSVIGALYALGTKKKDLLLHYIALPTMITFIGGVMGALLGFSKIGIPIQMADCYNYFSIPNLEVYYPAYLILYSIVMPPIASVIVNFFVMNNRLSQSALSLMRNEQKTRKMGHINLGKMKFIRLFQIRQMIREKRSGFTIVCGMVISLLILMLGLNCYVLCQNVKKDSMNSTSFEYMYSLKYPEKEVPEGGEACYVESLSKTTMGYTIDISVIGIDEENPYYHTKPATGKSNIVISKSIQQKYGLDVGDKWILTDNAEDMDYAFTIKGACDYANGLAVFMDIDSMRELFGQEDDYYNMLLSDKELSIDEGRLYSVTTREDVEHSASVFIELMMPMVTMMVAASIIIFCMVLYLMMGVMIDRASFGISLVQVFGFRTGEIRKLYLNGNTWIVMLGAIIGIPLAKKIMNMLYPWMIANTACGMNLAFPWYLYAVIFAGVIVVYFIVNALLVRKLKKITPAEVLKNRE